MAKTTITFLMFLLFPFIGLAKPIPMTCSRLFTSPQLQPRTLQFIVTSLDQTYDLVVSHPSRHFGIRKFSILNDPLIVQLVKGEDKTLLEKSGLNVSILSITDAALQRKIYLEVESKYKTPTTRIEIDQAKADPLEGLRAEILSLFNQ